MPSYDFEVDLESLVNAAQKTAEVIQLKKDNDVEDYSSHLTRCRCVWCFLGYYPRFCCGGGMSCCIIFNRSA